MRTSQLWYQLLGYVLSQAWASSTADVKTRKPPPNIVLILADQMRFDVSYSSPAHRTPNLDRLAQRGAFFLSAYSSTPTCTPARAALLSGLSPWHHGMLGYGNVAPQYPTDLSQLLRQHQYYDTVVIGKNHFGWNTTTHRGIAHGYESMLLYDGLSEFSDDYDAFFHNRLPGHDPMETGLGWNDWASRPYVFDEYMHPTAWTGRETLQYIQNRSSKSAEDDDRPLFLKVSFHRPHSPYDPPQRWLDRVIRQEVTPPTVGGNWDAVYNNNSTGCDSGKKDAWCGAMDPEAVLQTRASYLANVMMVDEWIGRIYDAMKTAYPNTYFVFTSDHGDMQGDHNLWRKGYPYEGSSHIPMLIEWPEGSGLIPEDRRGTRVEEVVELRDVLPTIAQIADIDVTPSLQGNDGKSMVCLLNSNHSCPSWRPYLDLEHSVVYNETVHWNALTDGRQKYVFRAFFGDEQLFDLIRDPHELHNLVNDRQYQFHLQLWRSRMVEQFRTEGRGQRWVTVNGQLQHRVKGQLYSPNYPSATNLRSL